MQLSRDINGNKILVLSGKELGNHKRGFSIQTLGNLPETHRMTNDNLNTFVAWNEVRTFINEHGTENQKYKVNIKIVK